MKTEKPGKNIKRSAMGKGLWICREFDLVCEGNGDAGGEGGAKYGSS